MKTDMLKKLIKEVLSTQKIDCGCGCNNGCVKAPILNENLQVRVLMTDNMKYHIDNNKPLTETTLPYGSKEYLDLWVEARYLYSRGAINAYGIDKEKITETHLGEYGIFEGQRVPLDMPMLEENSIEEVAWLRIDVSPYRNSEIKNRLVIRRFNSFRT